MTGSRSSKKLPAGGANTVLKYMDAIQQGETLPIEDFINAQQVTSTSPPNGNGSTQPKKGKAVKNITQAGEGMESSGQGEQATEAGGQEVTSPLIKAAQTVLDKYDASIRKSKTREPSQNNIDALYNIAARLGLDVDPDMPHSGVANQIEAAILPPSQQLGRGLQINENQLGLNSVISKAAKQDEGEGEVAETEGEAGEYEKEQLRIQELQDAIDKKKAADAKIAADNAALLLQAKQDAANKLRLKKQGKKTKKVVEDTSKTEDGDEDEVIEDTTKPLSDDSLYGIDEGDDNDISGQIDFGDFDYSGYDYESVAPTSETTEHTAASLSKTLSPEMKRLVASGKAVIHDTAETLPEGKHPENVQGLTTAEGVTHYVANKLTPETLENVALHEVGTHVGMENLVGAKVYKDIAHQALNNVGEVFDKARAAIPKDTPTHLRHHEALAYLVENAPHLPVVKKIVSAVRNFARMHLGMRLQLTEADARHLAVKALRKESKTTKRTARKEGTSYSVKPNKDAQALGTSLNEADLVQTSDKSMSTSIKEGIEEASKGNLLSKIRTSWIDKTGGLSRLLKPLPMFDKSGALRADMVIQANEQLYNVIRNSDGYLVYAGDGTLMSVTEKRLALEDIFKRIDALGYKDSRKTFFSAMRVLTGEQSLRKDAEQRVNAKLYKDFADVLQKDSDKLTEALVDARRSLEAAKSANDTAQIQTLKDAIKDINKELKTLNSRMTKLKEASNKLYARHGRQSASDIQADITAKEAKAQQKEDLAAKATDKVKRDALLDQAAALREAADKMTKTLEEGVGTEKLVTPEQIAEVKELLAKDARLEPIMHDIWEGLRKLVDLWEVGGLVDSVTANDWRDNPSYIPLYKSMDDLVDNPSDYVEILKVGAKQLGKVETRKGSLQKVNVGENLIRHQSFMAGAAAQNTARRIAVTHMAKVSPSSVYESGPDDPQATMFRVNGEAVYYHIDDPVAFEAFQSLLPLTPGWIMKTAQAHTKVFRAVTLINPLYWYRQLIRDPMMASLVTQSGLITPLHAAYHMAKILTGFSKEYKTLKRHGIVGAVDSITDPKQFVQGIAAKRGIVKWAIDGLMHIHESTDAATRVAVYNAAYKAAPKKGIVDPQQRENYAAMQAREVINFSKKGNNRRLAAIRATVPFFSAQLNGMDTLARAAFPGSYGNLNQQEARLVRKHFYANAAMITTASILYALQMDDDEEYRNSPDWMNSWLVPTGDKNAPFFKIPIPFEAGFFFKVIPELLVRVSKYSLTPAEGWEALRKGGKDLLLPPMLPQLLKPILETITNHDFHTGNNIESFTESRLPLNQRTAHASALAEKIGEGIPDFLNMSPDKIEHLGKGWFTEAWALSSLLADAYLSSVSGVSAPTKALGEKFLWKGVYTAPNKDTHLSKYYALAKSAEQIVNGVRAYKKAGEMEKAKTMRGEPENVKLRRAAPALGTAGDQIATLQSKIARIKHTPDVNMSPDEKAARIRELEKKINIAARKAVKRSDAIGVER
jgi:hypothetical protein